MLINGKFRLSTLLTEICGQINSYSFTLPNSYLVRPQQDDMVQRPGLKDV